MHQTWQSKSILTKRDSDLKSNQLIPLWWAKLELECLLIILIYMFTAIQNSGSLVKTGTENAGASEIISKEKSIKCVILQWPFCFFLIKILVTILPSWVLWSLLVCDKTIRCSTKWFILAQISQNLESVHIKYVT